MRVVIAQTIAVGMLITLGLSVSHAVKAAEATTELPEPAGAYPIGTRTLELTDAARQRKLPVTAWYPSEPGSARAPYMDPRTARELAAEWNLQPRFERRVRGHAGLNAPIASGRWPVVLLEHGSGLVPALYTVLAEGLASHGFVVIATNHPPDSLIAVFADGHEIKSSPYWPEHADRRTQGVAIGKFAEDTLVRDVRFVLDSLAELNLHNDFWRGRLDLNRVGIAGHSMGGTTAALATRLEPRICAGVNLDGSAYPGMNADLRPIEVHKPFLFLATEEHAANPDTRVREYVGSAGNSYYVIMRGQDHLGFTDAGLIAANVSSERGRDQIRYQRALLSVELTRVLTVEFLAKYLMGASAPTLDALVQIDRN